MTKTTPVPPQAAGPGAPEGPRLSREERLAAALRANLQRRKAQARGRAAQDEAEEGPEGSE